MSKKSKHPADALKQAVGQGAKSNKHITKITAKPSSDRPDNAPEKASESKTASQNAPKLTQNTSELTQSPAKLTKKQAKLARKNAKKDRKDAAEKPLKEVFILARPFVALGRYLRDSWREIRRVRWPNRKATWKMTGAVLAYCVAFMVFIVLLDSFFTWIFSLIIK